MGLCVCETGNENMWSSSEENINMMIFKEVFETNYVKHNGF